jgi:hypothetical protein
MAGDLILEPGTIQTVGHDLESSFWVLLWIMLSFLKTGYVASLHSSILKQTMDPKCFGGSGGSDKISFMTSTYMISSCITPDTPLVGEILRSMHSVLGKRYPQSLNDEDKVVQKEEDFHELIIPILKDALDKKWPDPDPSPKSQEVLLSDEELYSVHSGTKRSRSIAEQNGAFVQQPAAKRSEGP